MGLKTRPTSVPTVATDVALPLSCTMVLAPGYNDNNVPPGTWGLRLIRNGSGMALRFVLGLSEILLGVLLEVTGGRRWSCPFDVPGPLHGTGMPQTCREEAECVKTDVSGARMPLGTFQTMLMFHGFLDTPKGKDSQRIGQVKVELLLDHRAGRELTGQGPQRGTGSEQRLGIQVCLAYTVALTVSSQTVLVG